MSETDNPEIDNLIADYNKIVAMGWPKYAIMGCAGTEDIWITEILRLRGVIRGLEHREWNDD